MKKLFFSILLIAGLTACTTDQVANTAIKTEGVAIPSVNAAMQVWANYVNEGKATQTQVASVSNAYSIYFNSQLVASNLAQAYVLNPSTNLANALQLAVSTATASQTNIVLIIGQLTK